MQNKTSMKTTFFSLLTKETAYLLRLYICTFVSQLMEK